MGRVFRKILVVILSAALLTGCGVTDVAEKTMVARKSAASGSAAGNAVTSSRMVGSRDANDYTSYTVPRHEDRRVFWGQQEEDPDGYKYSMDMDISELQWVTNEWLYYVIYEAGKTWLYRVPIERSEKEGRPQKDKKEKLCKAQDLSVAYATEDYLVLIRCDDTKYDYELCRFDLDTRRQSVLLGHKETEGLPGLLSDDRDGPVWINGNLIVEGVKKLFLVNPDTGENKEIYSWHIGDEDEGIYDYEQIGSSLYFLLGDSLYQYDGITGKVTLFVRKAVFREAAEKKEELFCAPIRDPQSLCREDELMDYLDKNGEYYLLDEEDEEVGLPLYSHTSSIEDMSGGMIYVQYETKKDSRYVRYDPEMRKIEVCSWDEWRYERRD